MKVIWARKDLAEVILSLQPAICDIVSITGEHLVLPILDLDRSTREAISCKLSSFFISNNHCSVLVASFSKPDLKKVIDMYNGFWVTSSVLLNTIQLNYKEIPKDLIKKELQKGMGNCNGQNC